MKVRKAFQPIGASVADKRLFKMHNHILDDSMQSFSTNRSECSRQVVYQNAQSHFDGQYAKLFNQWEQE